MYLTKVLDNITPWLYILAPPRCFPALSLYASFIGSKAAGGLRPFDRAVVREADSENDVPSSPG
jgi:hypothetical protein